MSIANDASSPKLSTDLRRDRMVAWVEQRGAATSEELAERFGVSLMTVWRDLTLLDESGRLRRIRGGAAQVDKRPDVEPLYVSKKILNQEKKEAIARYAAEHFIEDGDIVFVEAGTTVAAMVKHLARYRQLTVIGNGLGTMNELARLLPNVTVYCAGGMLRDVGLTFVGPHAEEFFRHVNARTCFLSATGLTIPEGITDPNTLEIQVKRAMVGNAGRVVVLIDSTKFGVKSLAKILSLEEIDILITDADAPEDFVEKLRATGVEVHIRGVEMVDWRRRCNSIARDATSREARGATGLPVFGLEFMQPPIGASLTDNVISR